MNFSLMQNAWMKVFFWTNTENVLLLIQIRILSIFFISLSKMYTLPPKKKSSNIHKSQELSGPLQKY
jgi:hypothetical protein